MTLFLPVLIGSVIVLLLALVLFYRPAFKTVKARKPEILADTPTFAEEYSVELAEPVRPKILDPVPELPRSYGMDRLVLMVRDPYWLYAYWEITATKMDEISSQFSPGLWESSRTVLRVYDVTGIDFNGNNALCSFDCSLGSNTDEWYISVPSANRTYCVDIGRVLPDGSFITILRSNPVTTPRDSLSDRFDEEWMWIEGLYFRQQMGVSSPLIIEELAERMGRLPIGISSPGFYNPHE
ncbi:MAG: hypothetical protein JL50_16135 [Peptococcaceae bacterium BICA1-7]|nr:MAG: hypothetical protein JL50_16135 [Peptococcaceae bacterium BICA1-7]